MSSQPKNLDEILGKLGQVNQKLAEDFLKSLSASQKSELSEVYQALTASISHETEHWMDIQARYYQKQMALWMKMLDAQTGPEHEPVIAPGKGDRRFHASEWKDIPLFDYLRQSYLLTSDWLMELVDSAKLEPQTKRKLRFFTRQYLDAMSPSNFPTTNPEALKLAMESDGASIAAGLQNFLEDLEKGRISMTDESAFEVGRNIAVTPGAVVCQNEVMQLLQYSPVTETVYQRPLLIVPPFINKYYILDLQPENSLVRYALEQGHAVFLVSWRNIPPELGATTWDDYIEKGVFKPLQAALEITGSSKLNVLGFCVGGTLLACALAILRAKKDTRMASATFLTSMLDFSEVGEISVYLDEAYVQKRERDFAEGGLMPGKELAFTFASLRANELIWYYVVNNYLKGKKPEPFDLLYWNGDGSNLPGKLYAYYVRNMYLENNLKVPGKLTMCGTPVDLGRINLPAFVLAAREDHIVPWKSAHASARLLKGKVEFVLAASGHIAGVVNPASRNRRNYWINKVLDHDAEQWLAAAQSVPGSWWNHWGAWLEDKAGKRIPAGSRFGNDKYREIEPAPGSYVKVRYD